VNGTIVLKPVLSDFMGKRYNIVFKPGLSDFMSINSNDSTLNSWKKAIVPFVIIIVFISFNNCDLAPHIAT